MPFAKDWQHLSKDDLKEKFEWAESHPDEAKKIANEATKLMRYLTSEEAERHESCDTQGLSLH